MVNYGEKVAFIWGVADLIRDVFKRSKYQDVILPLTVLRRIDCVLEPTKPQVLLAYNTYKDKLDNLDEVLQRESSYAFYNTSPYTFERLINDPSNIASNLRHYINGFSPNMREVIEKFDFDNIITRLNDAGLLFQVLERFNGIDLHPDVVSNQGMGYIFEELIRKFNEATNENPGEHFTPREVINLMVNLLLVYDTDKLSQSGIVQKVYDPCCGTGGMLTTAKEEIERLNPQASVYLYGQEVNPETFAVCKSDLYMKSADGSDAENIRFGSTLSNPQHRGESFDYILANPPYGKDWNQDFATVNDEAERGHSGRFGAGTPRKSDGQLLFLQHMISHMNNNNAGVTRIAIVLNGSPLFTGDAGSGESEIRRWILENDWLDAIIALPEQLFYNTGIATYIWILTNHKEPHRKGHVQLIDATGMWVPMRKSLGDKRREISPDHIQEIRAIYEAFNPDDERNKIFPTTHFGYRKITVERPLRLNFHKDRAERLWEQTAFQKLAVSKKKKDTPEKAAEEAAGREQQSAILTALATLPDGLYTNREAFLKDVRKALKQHEVKPSAAIEKMIVAAMGEQDENADVCLDKDGAEEADSSLRDYENVPLGESIEDYFRREVLPYVPDAWINADVRDLLDGEVGRIGYEINFNRYFYIYQPPRPLHEIEADIKRLEREIMKMLKEVTE